MQLGLIGLGRMGAGLAQRLAAAGHEVIGFDVTDEARQRFSAGGARSAPSVAELVAQLQPPRAVWVMVPAGEPTEATCTALFARLAAGDTIVDGGNSNHHDTRRRAEAARARGIDFVDCGTSGGLAGRTEGYSLMIGGAEAAVQRLRPLFEALAPASDRGWGHVGPAGAGHYTKMIHNGIEYGLMEAFAEGFAILHRDERYQVDVRNVAAIWQYGSIVSSHLLDMIADALREDPQLRDIEPWVADSGEGRWTVQEALELDVPAPIITLALVQRLRSRDAESFGDRLLAAMRNQFGGHALKRG